MIGRRSPSWRTSRPSSVEGQKPKGVRGLSGREAEMVWLRGRFAENPKTRSRLRHSYSPSWCHSPVNWSSWIFPHGHLLLCPAALAVLSPTAALCVHQYFPTLREPRRAGWMGGNDQGWWWTVDGWRRNTRAGTRDCGVTDAISSFLLPPSSWERRNARPLGLRVNGANGGASLGANLPACGV